MRQGEQKKIIFSALSTYFFTGLINDSFNLNVEGIILVIRGREKKNFIFLFSPSKRGVVLSIKIKNFYTQNHALLK